MTPDELTRSPRGPDPARIGVDDRRSTARDVETLADLPPLRDRLLFVGLNPSPVSVDGRPLPPGPPRAGVLAPADDGRDPAARTTPIETADDALVAAGHGITDLLKCTDRPRRGDRRRADRRGRAAVAEDRDLATGRGRLHLQARGGDLGRPGADRVVGPAGRRRARRPAVLPDARAVRRRSRRSMSGPQLPAQPRGGAAGGSRLAAGDDRRPRDVRRLPRQRPRRRPRRRTSRAVRWLAGRARNPPQAEIADREDDRGQVGEPQQRVVLDTEPAEDARQHDRDEDRPPPAAASRQPVRGSSVATDPAIAAAVR